MTNPTNVTDFESAESYLADARNGHDRPLEYATRLIRRDEDTIAVRYHETDVVTYHRYGDITLNSEDPSGEKWRTVTTNKRLNDYQDRAVVWQENGVWYLKLWPFRGDWDKNEAPIFADGITLSADGTVHYEGDAPRDPENVADLTKRINTYAKAYAAELVDHQISGRGRSWHEPTRPELRDYLENETYSAVVIAHALRAVATAPLYRQAVARLLAGEPIYRFPGPDLVRSEMVRVLRTYLKQQFEIAR